jgi:hypothetical protein
MRKMINLNVNVNENQSIDDYIAKNGYKLATKTKNLLLKEIEKGAKNEKLSEIN